MSQEYFSRFVELVRGKDARELGPSFAAVKRLNIADMLPEQQAEQHWAAVVADAAAIAIMGRRFDLATWPLRLLRKLVGSRLARAGKGGKCCCGCGGAQNKPCRPSDAKDAETDPLTLDLVRDAVSAKGELLPRQLRNFVERFFRCDLDHVRIHSDEHADAAASRVHVPAFTVGSHIMFALGQYDPDRMLTAMGKPEPDGEHALQLLIHELVHVLQQSLTIDLATLQFNSDPRLEQEAESWVERLPFPSRQQQTWGPSPRISPARRSIQRLPPDQARAKCRAMRPLLFSRAGEVKAAPL